tara:strand:+ start:1791 stop:2186 length:396 start_codon:yes stop_codon:yes gene_type:complete
MKNSKVKFLRILMQNGGATTGRVYHVPLESISEIKKTPAADASTPGTVIISYKPAGSNVTITATNADAGTQAQNNAVIDAIEAELINIIELAINGSKNVVTVPWSEGQCLNGTTLEGQEKDATKLLITPSA